MVDKWHLRNPLIARLSKHANFCMLKSGENPKSHAVPIAIGIVSTSDKPRQIPRMVGVFSTNHCMGRVFWWLVEKTPTIRKIYLFPLLHNNIHPSIKIIKMKLSIGSDHAGFEMKEQIKNHLQQKGITLTDRGTHSIESTDYPDYAHLVATDVADKISAAAILLCGSANGVCMTANKHKGVRAALCWTVEIASLARQHNDANIICIPARYVDASTAFEMVDTFLKTEFEGGRHQKRVEKINV